MVNSQKYPIGIQTFAKIREEGYSYVDKTGYIPKLLNAGPYIFLSRPRRFGKSLLLSTLESYFRGERELFRGLAVDKEETEWIKYPVLHIDLNAENYMQEDGLDKILDRTLRDYEDEYRVTNIENSYSGRFAKLLQTIVARTGVRAVILVDEYDKPLLGIEDKPGLFEKNQSILKGFFGVLKSMDRYIHFAMLTGVARFNKVSIFSDLNNLRDISLSGSFADICGWSQVELVANFTPGIERLAEKTKLSLDATIEMMRDFYDGYVFAEEGSRLYNPFSVLNALSDERLAYYWFQSGTPTFLIKRIRDAGISLPNLNESVATEDQLLAVGFNDPNPVPLMFQTGYLTIKEVLGNTYILHFPNREVEIGFSRSLQPLFLPEMEMNGPFSVWKYQQELTGGKPQDFMRRMETMFKAVPYEQHNEAFYQNAVYILFTMIGADTRLEEHTSQGRADLVVRTREYVYVFEFKYNGNPMGALFQIRNRDYAGRFNIDPRQVWLIGANFTTKSRGLESWTIEEYDKGNRRIPEYE